MLHVEAIVSCCLLCVSCYLSAVSAEQYDANTVNEFSDWKCSNDEECTAEFSYCVDQKCQCLPGYFFNSDMTACLKMVTDYGGACTESVQCSRYLLSGGVCKNNACDCAEGYHYLHGRCTKYSGLNGPCKIDSDCYVSNDFDASSCVDGTCKCSEGYYQREYRDCRRIGSKVGDDCLIDNDCKFSEQAYCEQKKCAEKPTNAKTTFSAGFQVPQRKASGTKKVGDKCNSNDDCAALGNAECNVFKECTCKRAYFVPKKGTTCVAELGEPCKEGEKSGIRDAVCRKGRWACDVTKVIAKNKRKCEKVSAKYNLTSCTTNENCVIFGTDAVCNDLCICNEKSHLVASENYCWTNKGFDQECQHDFDCFTKEIKSELKCLKNVCTCPEGSRLNGNGTGCVKSAAEIGAPCEENLDCLSENAVCLNALCTCNDTYFESNGKCVAGINATCTTDKDCAPKNSECVSQTCTCVKDHVTPSVDTCIPVSSFGGSCEHDIQCFAVTENAICASFNLPGIDITVNGSVTVTLKNCACNEGYRYKHGQCLRKRVLGESCTKGGECYLDFDEQLAVCKNGQCACDWGYAKETDTVCRKTSGAARNVVSRLLPVLLVIVTFFKVI